MADNNHNRADNNGRKTGRYKHDSDNLRGQRSHSRGRDDRRGDERPHHRHPRRSDKDNRTHSNRAGSRGGEQRRFHAQRPGYREERINQRINEPDLPDDLDIKDLDPMVLQDLKVLSKDNATAVAKHLLMAALWMNDDPQLALRHARAAKNRAGRVSVVRETCGIAAYHAGEWKEALSELRAARRMSGGPGLIAVMADAERGLGRPEKAIEIAREIDPRELDIETRIELAIVVAGARHDLGQLDSALATLQNMNPDSTKIDISWARLSYAYADALAAVGRVEEARRWFSNAAAQDIDGYLDAKERIAELPSE